MGANKEFMGFARPDGVGTRNHVGVMCTVGCSADVVNELARKFRGVKPLVHHQGCALVPSDLERTKGVLVGLGLNPNLHSLLLVGLGCEGVPIDEVADEVAKVKQVEAIAVQEVGGMAGAVRKGGRILKKLIEDAGKCRRESFGVSELTLGIKCGASDATTGIVTNQVAGKVADMLIDKGATVVFSETTELIGAEHILARRAASGEVAEKLLRVVEGMERRIMAAGEDVRGGQPTRGNIEGGITTLEEKSLGAVAKSGSRPLMGVVDYGERPKGKGLYFMDGPGREMEALTGLAAGGSQIALFTTGRGAPQGFPIVPVLKVSGNPETCWKLAEHIDVDVSGAVKEGLEKAAEKVYGELLEVSSGKLTKAEICGYDETFEIYVRGPVI